MNITNHEWNIHEIETLTEAEAKEAGLIYDPVCYAYYDPQYADFVKKHIELLNVLCEAEEKVSQGYAYLKKAFLHEMWNHEYAYNLQADFDVLSVFGDIKYVDALDELEQYFTQLGFNDIQRRAYIDARKEYYKEFDKGDE